MSAKITNLRPTLVLLTLLFVGATLLNGQGTAFTYQGQLKESGAPANGAYDMRFALFNSTNGAGQVGSTLTNKPVVVANGLFTVSLDFGASTFTGASLWLEVGVRTNGSADAYATLSPRQPVTATPYAFFAPNAGTATTANSAASVTANAVNAAAIQNGVITADKISSGQVVKSLNGLSDAVTLSAGANISLTSDGNNLQISASSGGSGSFTWQTVTGISQQSQPNTGYIATNSAQVTITLPPSPNVGTSVRVVGIGSGGWKIAQNAGQSILAGNISATPVGVNWTARESSRTWQSVASSANGTRLVAVVAGGRIYASYDSGTNWTAREASRTWASVASSADGTRLVAAVNRGQIYVSGDSGVNWTPRESSRVWKSVASSSDGTKLIAVVYGGLVYLSSDSGVSWTPRENTRNWQAVAISGDGTKLAAAVFGGQIYTSSDSGDTWAPREISRNWQSVAMSADGTKLVAVVSNASGGQVHTSIDSGINWTARDANRLWKSVASSADGTRLIAAVLNGQIYLSSDSGVTWTPRETNRYWQAVASSADGARLVAVTNPGQIYTSVPGASTVPGPEGFLTGEQGSAIELLYVGNNQFVPLSFVPPIKAY